jgi:hypothetical protein
MTLIYKPQASEPLTSSLYLFMTLTCKPQASTGGEILFFGFVIGSAASGAFTLLNTRAGREMSSTLYTPNN